MNRKKKIIYSELNFLFDISLSNPVRQSISVDLTFFVLGRQKRSADHFEQK
jgi:hypothetical protein